MSDVEQALKDMSEKYRSGLAQLQTQVESTKRSDSKQYPAAKRQLEMFRKEQWLIDKAREIANGNQAAIADIDQMICNRVTPAHTRMLAALLLATIDSPKSLEVLAGRIVDKSDTDALRFFCAMQICNCQNPAAVSLVLRAINDPSTDEEFDEDAKLRAKMVNAGVPVNLRRAMILGLLDGSGSSALAAKVKSPMTFQHGWLFSILSLWGKTDSESWVVLAAEVLKNRGNPGTMRVNAATALYVMRKDSKGRTLFPKAAWDALHSAWAESSSGKLHGVVGEVLKLQGA
ncbi:MAG: hypothetical protein WBD07_09725 [Vicinamibacterales bacterium]